MVRKLLKEYFSFSRREQNGILVLSSFIVVLVLVNLVLSWLPEKRLHNAGNVKEIVKDFEMINGQTGDQSGSQESHTVSVSADTLFYFDPNLSSKEELMVLGMSEKVAITLLHYVEKGGKFYKKEDLLKIYGMDTALYAKLEPYIRIVPSSGNSGLDSQRSADLPAIPVIELNQADTADLLPLKGIGPVLARRVLKYRNLLGGFATKDQLLEVYGISEEVFRELSSAVRVDTAFLEKMDLNHATYAEFLRHPYFDRELVNAILAYRKKQGTIMSVSEIRREGMVTEKEYRKILPYVFVGKMNE